MTFQQSVKAFRRNKSHLPRIILALDPGGTTGWCVFREGILASCGQLDTRKLPEGLVAIANLLSEVDKTSLTLNKVVMESYLFFGGRTTKAQTGSELLVPQLIGVVRYVCAISSIPITLQSPSSSKAFVTDDRLKEWGYYQIGQRHANDAIRHATHWILFDRQ